MATLTTVAGALQADVHVSVNGGRVASIRVGSSPRTLYLHRDRLTSVVGTTLAGGVRGATYLYGPHGALVAATGDAGDAASELGYAGTLRLTGGLLLMGARIYDPNLKVFLQPDPLAPHSYTYAGGDPINRWDPTGFEDKPVPKCEKDCPPPGKPTPDSWSDAMSRFHGGPIGVLWSRSGSVGVIAVYSAATADTPGAVPAGWLDVALQKPTGWIQERIGSEWIVGGVTVDESSFIPDSFDGGGRSGVGSSSYGGGGSGAGSQRNDGTAGWGGLGPIPRWLRVVTLIWQWYVNAGTPKYPPQPPPPPPNPVTGPPPPPPPPAPWIVPIYPWIMLSPSLYPADLRGESDPNRYY